MAAIGLQTPLAHSTLAHQLQGHPTCTTGRLLFNMLIPQHESAFCQMAKIHVELFLSSFLGNTAGRSLGWQIEGGVGKVEESTPGELWARFACR